MRETLFFGGASGLPMLPPVLGIVLPEPPAGRADPADAREPVDCDDWPEPPGPNCSSEVLLGSSAPYRTGARR